MVSLWQYGLDLYESGLAEAGREKEPELNAARAVQVSLESCLNAFRLFELKCRWRPDLMVEFLQIVTDEKATLEKALPVYAEDPRQGFHQENRVHMVTPDGISRKIQALDRYLRLPE
jgi:hypothetical protein